MHIELPIHSYKLEKPFISDGNLEIKRSVQIYSFTFASLFGIFEFLQTGLICGEDIDRAGQKTKFSTNYTS